jgi:monofunctional biosynthetic peptidoglycan transglycosylase
LLQQEDDFYYHSGVDWLRMARAFTKNLAARRYRYGASTITMQLARELYLGKERTLLRKIREIAYALQLERRLSKEEILGLYLNVVHWGPSIRGVGAAACYYFGVPPAGLDAEQAAQLVALLPSPDRLGPPLREAVQAARE